MPVSTLTAVETVTTRIEKDDDSRTVPRLEARHDTLSAYGRSGFQLASTITVPSGGHTIIVDTLIRASE
ncbi:MAG: hypothetical protein ABIR17_13030 [Pseudolysinimonas sp.]|uniref:hypothetical protein n=1 Tax=Pseudolysinimonas sp. TaxID=2680009 RepID=UPI003262E73B